MLLLLLYIYIYMYKNIFFWEILRSNKSASFYASDNSCLSSRNSRNKYLLKIKPSLKRWKLPAALPYCHRKFKTFLEQTGKQLETRSLKFLASLFAQTNPIVSSRNTISRHKRSEHQRRGQLSSSSRRRKRGAVRKNILRD